MLTLNPVKIGERIKTIRKLRNLTQQQLGNMVGLAKNTINRIELGLSQVRTENLQKIADKLNVDINYLYTDVKIESLNDILPNNTTDRKIDDVNSQIQNLKSIIEQQQLENQKLTDEIGKLKNRSNQAVFDFNDILKDWDKETQDYLMAIGRIDKTGKASKYSIHMILLDLVKKIKPNDSNKNKDDED